MRVQQTEANACHHGGTSARAASQGFTRAAFVDTQAHFGTRQNLHEARVDAAHKSRMVFNLRAPNQHRRRVDRLDNLHRMRIPHGHDRSKGGASLAIGRQFERPGGPAVDDLRRQASRVKRHFSQVKHRRAHVDTDPTIGLQRERQHAVHGLHAHRVAHRQLVVAHVANKAARAVAAVLHLLAVGVVNRIRKIDVNRTDGRGSHAQYLVCADTEVTVGQKSVLRGAQAKRLPGLVEHHEIIAGALHFGESNSHAGIIRRPLRGIPAACPRIKPFTMQALASSLKKD